MIWGRGDFGVVFWDYMGKYFLGMFGVVTWRISLGRDLRWGRWWRAWVKCRRRWSEGSESSGRG